MKSSIVLTVVFLIVSIPAVAEDEEVWTPEIMMRERTIAGTSIAPCGKWVAYGVREAIMEEEKSEYLTHIWITSIDGETTFKLTAGEKSCSRPAWSPRGQWIAFSSSRSGKNNIWIIRPFGGEAVQLTDVKDGVGAFRWAPDGKSIAFTMRDPESEEEEKAKKAKKWVKWVGEDFKYSHIYVVQIQSDPDKPQEPKRITEGEFDVNGFDWAPDGKTLVFSHRETPEIDSFPTTNISMTSLDGEITPLVTMPHNDSNPKFSPDGELVAYVADIGESHWAGARAICVIPASGGAIKRLALTSDQSPMLLKWAPDGSGVYYFERVRTSSHTFFLPVDGGNYSRITNGESVFSDVDINAEGTFFVMEREDFLEAPELYKFDIQEALYTKLTSINDDMPKLAMSRSEIINWKSFDGKEIEGILHYPLNFVEGKKYPLLLLTHGGPAGVFMRTFTAGAGIYPIQAFTAKGFAILCPNPRGSTAYGKEFRFANYRDLGGGDYEDVIAGVDKVIEMGVADPERMGAMGWSYGGYMTSVIITKTNRFKAAAAGAAPTNTISYIGVTDIRGFYPSYLGAEFWEDPKTYRDKSPVHNVGNCTTPTLFIHGENDIRVPTNQGRQLHQFLKRKGIDTRMVILPRTPHGPREPKLTLEVARLQIEWFEKYLLVSE